jgi:hypothetical protein
MTARDDAYVEQIRARHAAAEGGAWFLAPEPDAEPGTVRTRVDGYQRTVGVFDFRGAPATADANREFVLYARSDIGYLLRDRARYADRAAMADRIRQLELALGSATHLLRSAAMHINAGQTPDPHRLRDSADELEQITADRIGGA